MFCIQSSTCKSIRSLHIPIIEFVGTGEQKLSDGENAHGTTKLTPGDHKAKDNPKQVLSTVTAICGSNIKADHATEEVPSYLSPIPTHNGPMLSKGLPFLFVTDFDDTLVGDADALHLFNYEWRNNFALRGCKLIYNTGRSLKDLSTAVQRMGYAGSRHFHWRIQRHPRQRSSGEQGDPPTDGNRCCLAATGFSALRLLVY
jgi:hypothetical protein